MITILVTGGAGYIGSAVVKELINNNFNVVVVDNLSKGKKDLVDVKAKFYDIDLVDKEKLEQVFQDSKIDVVMHFAGYKAVEESMRDAVKYSNNITSIINLLNCMIKYNIPKIIYSSSACVYGTPKHIPVDENSPIEESSSLYGYTKEVSEQLIGWYSKVHGLQYVSLRYFNVAGDAGLNYIDPEAHNVFPILMEVLEGKREKFMIYGGDYNTRDGTCIRDYIDINDLVKAHILALGLQRNEIINIGTSKGVSVKELVQTTKEITGKTLNYEISQRRKGDVAVLVASNNKAKRVLGWVPKRGIKDMVKSTYKAYIN